MIRVVHPESRIQMLTFFHPVSRIQGSKRRPIPDPDPQHCIQQFLTTVRDIINSKPVLWIRIRIGSGFNGVPGSGSGSRRAKMTHKKDNKFNFLSAVCFLLRAEVFSCSLDISKFAIFDQKTIEKIFSCIFSSSIFGRQNPGSGSGFTLNAGFRIRIGSDPQLCPKLWDWRFVQKVEGAQERLVAAEPNFFLQFWLSKPRIRIGS
jgi:hypothetical protein